MPGPWEQYAQAPAAEAPPPEESGPWAKYEKTAAPAPKVEPESKPGYWAQRGQEGKQIARNFADLGDMVLSTPGGLAANVVSMGGQLKDQVLESFKEKGKTHEQIGKEALEKNNELSERWGTNVLARVVNSVVGEGDVHGSDVQKAMGWLTGKIEQGAEFIDKATGGRLTKEEVQLESQLLMNLAGTKGLVKAGGKLWTKGTAPKASAPTEAPKPLMTPAEAPKEMSPEELKTVQDSWKEHVERQVEAKTEAVQQEKFAKRPPPTVKEKASAVAALSVGAAAGAYLDSDNPIVGAVLGSALVGGRKAYDLARITDPRTRIDALTDAREHEQGAGARYTWQKSTDVEELLPKKEDQVEVFRAIDEGRVATLTGKKLEAARKAEEFFKAVGEAAAKEGVLPSLRESYATHFWDKGDAAKVKELLAAHPIGPNMSPASQFAEVRRFGSMKEGRAAGLVPLTEALPEVMSKYGEAITTTIANKRMLDRLKTVKNEAGENLLLGAEHAPGNYVSINHPTLNRYRVHPDIAPSLKFLYEQQSAGGIMSGLSMVNTALKRNAVSFSLFHAKALADAMMGTTLNPLKVGKVVAQAALPRVFGKNKYLEQLRHGGAGDLADAAIRDGVKFSLEGRDPVDADITTGFYDTLKKSQQYLDSRLGPVAGLPIKGYIRVNHAFDNFMWARLHTAMKLEVYAAKREALVENTAKSEHPLTEKEAGRIAAEYANTVFGGLNWRRIAEGVDNKFGRDLALKTFSPQGMRGLQLITFAPDWTISTSRAFVKAFGEGSGIKGVFSARTAADLYRQQLLRSAFFYVLVGDAINYHFSGHHLWENRDKDGNIDPFYVHLGDGRRMQLSKHFTEPFHAMQKPGQTAVNKLGVLPGEALDQATGKDYIYFKNNKEGNSEMAGPPIGNRALHAAKRALPIGAGQFSNGVGPGVSGALGFPIYGKTQEQRAEEKAAHKAAQREARFQQRLERLRKREQGQEGQQ